MAGLVLSSEHQSMADLLAVMTALPGHFTNVLTPAIGCIFEILGCLDEHMLVVQFAEEVELFNDSVVLV